MTMLRIGHVAGCSLKVTEQDQTLQCDVIWQLFVACSRSRRTKPVALQMRAKKMHRSSRKLNRPLQETVTANETNLASSASKPKEKRLNLPIGLRAELDGLLAIIAVVGLSYVVTKLRCQKRCSVDTIRWPSGGF
jgi:hypothetical protein